MLRINLTLLCAWGMCAAGTVGVLVEGWHFRGGRGWVWVAGLLLVWGLVLLLEERLKRLTRVLVESERLAYRSR